MMPIVTVKDYLVYVRQIIDDKPPYQEKERRFVATSIDNCLEAFSPEALAKNVMACTSESTWNNYQLKTPGDIDPFKMQKRMEDAYRSKPPFREVHMTPEEQEAFLREIIGEFKKK